MSFGGDLDSGHRVATPVHGFQSQKPTYSARAVSSRAYGCNQLPYGIFQKLPTSKRHAERAELFRDDLVFGGGLLAPDLGRAAGNLFRPVGDIPLGNVLVVAVERFTRHLARGRMKEQLDRLRHIRRMHLFAAALAGDWFSLDDVLDQ